MRARRCVLFGHEEVWGLGRKKCCLKKCCNSQKASNNNPVVVDGKEHHLIVTPLAKLVPLVNPNVS